MIFTFFLLQKLGQMQSFKVDWEFWRTLLKQIRTKRVADLNFKSMISKHNTKQNYRTQADERFTERRIIRILHQSNKKVHVNCIFFRLPQKAYITTL